VKNREDSHSLIVGYLAWIFGFMGAHRFYYGKPKTGTLYFFTLGLFFIGWIVDFFLIPSMDSKADKRFSSGEVNYSLAWILLIYLGVFGVHRFYMGKWVTGLIYALTGGLFFVGWLYDLWTLNDQIAEINKSGQAEHSQATLSVR
jgi:TM2 domain-containing membrane protein YozV